MTGNIETSQANAVSVGMSRDEVKEILGEPAAVFMPEDVRIPSQVYESIGSVFRFNDSDLDEVWAYGHELRVRLKFLYGFRSGRLAQAWRETVTADRAAELDSLGEDA